MKTLIQTLILTLLVAPMAHADGVSDRLAIARSEELALRATISSDKHTQDVVLEYSTMTLEQLNALPPQKDKVRQALIDHYKRLHIWAHNRVQRCATNAEIQAHCDAEDEVDADLLTIELKN